MARLEELSRGATVKGVLADRLVTVVDIKWYGQAAIELTYKDASGRLGHRLLYRNCEADLEIAAIGSPWSFTGNGALLRLALEAHRIRLAHLFDPMLAVHTALVEPLPHQITAVYEAMLTRQPLRFLLADDPGAGKTIMAGLLIKELLARGDLQRCLVVCPGSLVEQWQDELFRRFGLPFEILTNDNLEAARTGNWFLENPLAISRLDKLARNDEVQAKLEATDWDLVVCDEAHKLSASFFSGEIKKTRRYRLAELLSRLTRHFLLMTATPHNGKEEDFQLFLALLDGDRFEGRFRDGVHSVDTSDLMRRLVKEQLLKFDGTPLFPERIAYTVSYRLSDDEALLYREVTDYVREEFNRADALEGDGRRGTIGFALQVLQRRLASSPEAIFQSLRRRRERLEQRLREETLRKRGAEVRLQLEELQLSIEDLEDLEDAPDAEVEATEERIVDQATASGTLAELEAEIAILRRLEALALRVRTGGTDRKWEELSRLLQDNPEMFDAAGHRRKLVLFTEHRDTLNYLALRIRNLLGREETVVCIHGGMGREERKKSEQAFLNDPQVQILVATDAAGEGINLQRAHLMVNYDLPWNPNRLEQRFGRIHRIGQTEVCHLWNLVAAETREGDVYLALLKKLEIEREALGGGVFDVLGKAIAGTELRSLLVEAVRYGDREEVRARLTQVVDRALDRDHLRRLLEERALAHDTMDASRVHRIREEMERAAARRLQPHFIAAFFREAFKLLGGSLREREPGRYEISHVPATVRSRDRLIGRREALLARYERITFDKALISLPGVPLAAYVSPGHPLLDAVIDLMLERHRDLLKQGAVLVDPNDWSDRVRALVYLEHTVQDGRTDRTGNHRAVSRQVQFVEIDPQGQVTGAGSAPYLDYRPLREEEWPLVADLLDTLPLATDLEDRALSYAVAQLVPVHFEEVSGRKEAQVRKTKAAVWERLTKEISHWDHRAQELKLQEQAGRQNAKINSAKAATRRDELTGRLHRRMEELEQERQLAPLPPVVIGGALVLPAGLLARLAGEQAHPDAQDRQRVEQLAMAAVMAAEQRLGYEPRDVSADKSGYDIESRVPGTGRLRFIEVKGRICGAETVTVTKNEILRALNKPDDWILAIVEVPPAGEELPGHAERTNGNGTVEVVYVRRPFGREPDFGATSVNYNLAELRERGSKPC
ncbi:helicase-related protein [Gloeobacter morelensis]|uniref:DUF3883 domain-containing protein n=1 Tax=Gloeobacter morelensis MG652769 TaxID=2781736 RepID=A0ABY3PJ20_9CYAN|nr:helicase-related protein [Gloeobacter morelensis]UFP93636.1 DUF3883 domain-containing protein [Gloeobacter morelensis MG652769]